MKRFFIVYIMLFVCFSAFAQTGPDQTGAEAPAPEPDIVQPAVSAAFLAGEDLFMQNKPDDALGYLQAAVAAPGAPIQAFLYLGIVYQQLGRIDEAIEIYQQVLLSAGEDTALVAWTLGNVYFGKGDFALAEESYTQAIEADPSSASAYLNRANARLQLGKADDAADDYNQYLTLDVNSSKKAQIERILALLKKEAEEEEALAAQKKADEEAAELAKALAEAAAEQQKAEKLAAKLAKSEEAEQKAQEAIPAIESTIQAMDTLSAVLKARAAQRAATAASPEAVPPPTVAPAVGDEKNTSTMSAN